MVKSIIRRVIDDSVKTYLSRLPDKEIARIIGALGLTDEIYKRLVESATGERHVEIYFNDGAYVHISNRKDDRRQVVGW